MKNNEHPDHQSRGHAEFSPSSLKYVANCPAYKGRDGTSAAAEKGTRIHEALEVRDPSALHDEEEVAIYEQIVEMEAAFMANFAAVEEEHNEIQVDVDLGETETFGTCDRFLVLEGGADAVMADYKTGISLIDPPENNWQAMAYVVGAFQRFENIQNITFVFYIPLHHDSPFHTFTRSELPALQKKLMDVITAAERIRPKWENGAPELEECNPTQYCRFCTYEDRCPALGGLVLDVVQQVEPTTDVALDINNLDDPANLSKLYNIARTVENWAARIKQRTVQAAKEGVPLDGLRLKSMGKTRRVNDNQQLYNIADSFGVTSEELLAAATFSVSKTAKLVGAKAPRGEKRKAEDNFIDVCESKGILDTSEERYTIASQ